ncbi:MAG: alpha/beta hydrolase [Bacteroidales bacterium]
MINYNRTVFVVLLWIFSLSGCDRYDLVPEVSIGFQNPTEVSETGFRVRWSVNPSGYTSLTFILASDPSFHSVLITRSFRDRSVNSTRVDSLRGATTYYYRISVEKEPGRFFHSKPQTITMPYRSTEVHFYTPDSIRLKGTVNYLASVIEKRPGVIMMHELAVFNNKWSDSEILRSLVAGEYLCLIYSNRGHGLSDYFNDLTRLIRDPAFLANDLRGAMNFITEHESVKADSIALLGASMGGTMAVTGNGYEQVQTSVALSAANRDIDHMFPGKPLQSIFYIAGEEDIGTGESGTENIPDDARDLYKMTEDPRKLLIVSNSAAHGMELLELPDIHEEIFQWILQHLPLQE